MDGSSHTEYNVNTPPAHILLEPGGFSPSIPQPVENLKLMFPAPLAPVRVGSSQFPEKRRDWDHTFPPGPRSGFLHGTSEKVRNTAQYCTMTQRLLSAKAQHSAVSIPAALSFPLVYR